MCSEQQPGNKDHCTRCALRSNCSHSAISSTPEELLLAVALLRLCSEQQPGNKDHCTWCALGSNCSHSDLCSEQQATPQEARHGYKILQSLRRNCAEIGPCSEQQATPQAASTIQRTSPLALVVSPFNRLVLQGHSSRREPLQASTQESGLCASFFGVWHEQRLASWSQRLTSRPQRASLPSAPCC